MFSCKCGLSSILEIIISDRIRLISMTFSGVAPMNYSRFIVDRFDEINKKDWKIEKFVEIMFS